MKTVLLAATALLASCGIQTIEVLPVPPVGDYTAQSNANQLTFTHTPSTYTSTPDFQGYEVYYRIYAASGVNLSDNLAIDVNLLAATPTVDYLKLIGYQRLNGSDTHSTSFPLVGGLSTSSNQTITLDFFSFLQTMNASSPPTAHTGSPQAPLPTITVRDASSLSVDSTFSVYRTVTSNSTYPWFSDLYAVPFVQTNDMKTTPATDSNAIVDSSILFSTGYEIDFFVAAYAFSPEQTIYSRPVPWGTIRYFKAAP